MKTVQMLVGVLSLSFASCAAPTMAVTPVFGLYEVEGTLGVSSAGAVTPANLQTAGLGDSEPGGGARIDLQAGSPHVTMSTHLSRHQGTGVLDAPSSDGGVLIPAGASTLTDLNLGFHQGLVTFDVLPGDLELGFGLGVSALEVDGDFTNTANGNVVATDKVLAVPIFAVRGGIEMSGIDFEVLLSGIDMGLNGNDLRFTDLDINGTWEFVGGEDRLHAALVIGYRRVNLDLAYDESDERVDADLQMDGPYVGLSVSL